jgi:hypothetical protein
MTRGLPPACYKQAQFQDGVLSRKQALDGGMSGDAIDHLLQAGRWQVIRRGVYLVNTGRLSRQAALWAVVYRVGPGVALSHQTAAELTKLSDERSSAIHVTIDTRRRVLPMTGVVIHRSSRIAGAVHPTLQPPRTRIEETVLDLTDLATTFDTAFGLVSTACQRRLTTTTKLAEAMKQRPRTRWRTELNLALAEIGDGVHSVLEYRYVRRVERPHGLPTAIRQVRTAIDGRRRYLDNLYESYTLCVELDGMQAHPDDQRWLDLRRANAITERGITILRYGWVDIDRHACQTAAQVGAVLQAHGWRGRVRPCRPSCPAPGQLAS